MTASLIQIGINKLIIFQNAATAIGGAAGASLVCANLPVAEDFIGQIVVPQDHTLSGPRIIAASTLGGTIIPDKPFDAQIPNGSNFIIIANRVPLAGLINQGLVYMGVVTAVPGANQFTIATLTGLGNTFFTGWSAQVAWDAGGAGAAPQGESQPVTAYVSATGIFTTSAYTAPVAVGDIIILINPVVLTLFTDIVDGVYFDSITGVAGTVAPVGFPGRPSNVPASVITMLAARNLKKVYVNGTYTLGANIAPGDPIEFIGVGSPQSVFRFNGFSAAGCTFRNLNVTGVCPGGDPVYFYDCTVACTVPLQADFWGCTIGNVTLVDAGLYNFHNNCQFNNQFSLLGLTAMTINIFDGKGKLTIVSSADAGNAITVMGVMQLVLNATDTLGTLVTAGKVDITGKSLAAMTITDVGNMLSEEMIVDTVDLNQAAGDYNVFTGAGQNVELESLVVVCPNAVAGGALTSISLHTDDVTPQVMISAVAGAVANLVAENQIGWSSGTVMPFIIGTGKNIVLTIAGGATGVAYVVTIYAKYRQIVAGGRLV